MESKKGTVPNLMWVIVVIIVILAFIIVFWLMAHGWLIKSGVSLGGFLDKAANSTTGL